MNRSVVSKVPQAFRTHPKNVFWPNIFVGASFKILNIQQYASGFKLGPAAILSQNPIFEMRSRIFATSGIRLSLREIFLAVINP